MWHNYYTVSSLDEALRLLAEHRERARIVAGATDLIIEIERGVRRGIETLIDITRLAGLNTITLDDQEWLHLGPLTTHNDCAASPLIQQRALPLAQACWEVGAPQIRNRATVAGNLITASPANDSITPLMALDAVVTLTSASGQHQVPLREFYTGVRRTVLQPDEVLTDIAFPAMRPNERGMFIKLALRRAQAISVVNVAACVEFETEAARGPVKRARIALGSVAPTIIRCPEAEAFLAGKALTPDVLAQAAELAERAARPIDDVRAPADYRSEMVRVTTLRALRSIAAGEERGWLPEKPVLLGGGQRSAIDPRSAPRLQLQSLHHADDELIVTHINGREYALQGANDKTLLRMLREDAGLIGTKEGCAEGECGACTVFLDGAAVMSCMVPAPRAHGAQIVTIEGLAAPQASQTSQADSSLHPLQRAFIEEGAVQCGYCTPGFLMAGAKLLEERPHPSTWEIQQAFTGNLCRCTGYYKILAAVQRAAK